MRKHLRQVLSFLALSLFFISSSFAQCSFDSDYSKIFVAQSHERPAGDKVLITKVATVDKSLCYAEAVNGMPDFFDYLKSNFTDPELYAYIDLFKDSVKLNKDYSKLVQDDDELVAKLQEYELKTFGKLPKDTVFFEEIIDAAVKFFTIKSIDKKGQYEGQVCSGINLIESTMDPRKAFLEAFAFSAIMYDLKNLSPNLKDEFVKESKQLYDLNLGVDEEERLLRAQGALLMAMKNNTRLSAILASHYAEHMAHLPFVIRGQ